MTTGTTPAAPAAPASPAIAAPASPAAAPQSPAPGQVATTPATPPADAPVAPAAPLSIDPPAPPATVPPSPSQIVYAPTGDAGLDVALDYVGRLGFGPEHPAIKAAETGDFGQLRTALAALGDKAPGYDRVVSLAEKSYKAGQEAAAAKAAADEKIVHEAAGGKEQWTAVQEWARANAEPAERAAVNAALKAGGIAAKAMAQYLAGLYSKSGKATQQPANPLANATGQVPASTPLTSREYATQVQALSQKLGGRLQASSEYAALNARRAAARAAGIN